MNRSKPLYIKGLRGAIQALSLVVMFEVKIINSRFLRSGYAIMSNMLMDSADGIGAKHGSSQELE